MLRSIQGASPKVAGVGREGPQALKSVLRSSYRALCAVADNLHVLLAEEETRCVG